MRHTLAVEAPLYIRVRGTKPLSLSRKLMRPMKAPGTISGFIRIRYLWRCKNKTPCAAKPHTALDCAINSGWGQKLKFFVALREIVSGRSRIT